MITMRRKITNTLHYGAEKDVMVLLPHRGSVWLWGLDIKDRIQVSGVQFPRPVLSGKLFIQCSFCAAGQQ